jgi:hypothetical protein
MKSRHGIARAAALVAALWVGGCAHHAPPVAATPAAASDDATRERLKAKLKECDALLAQRKLDDAKRCAKSVEDSGDYKLGRWGTYAHVTALVYEGDLAGAARLFDAMMARDRAQRNLENEAWGHNAMTWVRWGQRDLDGAIAENERVRKAVEASQLADDAKRGVLLHYWWDRAYLLVDKADVSGADEARATYEKLARLPDEHDGLAVLAAYFAVKRGDAKSARDAAKTVDPAKDDDIQDLYILWLAFDAAGDRAAADDIKRRIDGGNEYPMKALILRELAAAKK